MLFARKWRNMTAWNVFALASHLAKVKAMDIPNDLNKLLAQLKQVTTVTSRTSGTGAPSGSRPTAAEVEIFLRQHDFEPGAPIEQIEISNDGVFECYMFSVCAPRSGTWSLLAMRPDQDLPIDAGEPL
jgi:hypothetical protein